ncbi:hypothetical protein N8654_02140 [Synechococcus sp. AH-601-B19]|nr:hypothetical protein [Synechococcus sp. AH-601-B19]
MGSFNNANLGKVAATGTIENARSEANTILNNFKAEDTIAEMAYKAEAADATRDYRSSMASLENDTNRFNSITSGLGSVASAGIKGSEFSLFGGGGGDFDSAAASPGGSSGVSGIGGGMRNPFLIA